MERKIKIGGILFLIAFVACFLNAEMEALAAAVPEGEPAWEEPVTGVPIENTTLMYAVEKVNVRRAAGTDAEIIGELEAGELIFAVELLEEGWYRIVFDGETGYVRQDFLAVYGEAGAWEAPEQPMEPVMAGQDSVATGKRTVKGNYDAADDTESGKTPVSGRMAKAKKGNISTFIIIAAAVLLILGYSVIQVLKEKREKENGNDEDKEDGQEPEAETQESMEETGEWEEEFEGEEFAAGGSAEWEEGEGPAAGDSAEWEEGEEPAAADYAEDAGEAENLAEDELVILDLDEV